jgi:hypothetical protein
MKKNQRVIFQAKHRKVQKSGKTGKGINVLKLRTKFRKQQQLRTLGKDDSIETEEEEDNALVHPTHNPEPSIDNEEDTEMSSDNEEDDLYNMSKSEFNEYCKDIGILRHLQKVFNTKQLKTNTAESNARDADKRASIALSRTFTFLEQSLLCVVSSTEEDENNATNLSPTNHSVAGCFVHVMKHFSYFLLQQLEYLSLLNRAPTTVKQVLEDYDEIFLKYYLLSDAASSIIPEATVS